MPALGAAVHPGGYGQAVLADLGFDARRLDRRRGVAPALPPPPGIGVGLAPSGLMPGGLIPSQHGIETVYKPATRADCLC